ncbi:Myb domain protein 40 [Heracleum sosnowskyi]|uniref:Myb domain protein 40 n=1 Tax=Heracleum sosnowskyi TaxID=360622 RepID=A0AAD8MP16_9APIA|nr:Myb domain protein 40 [Heracleum sosnowskyi]
MRQFQKAIQRYIHMPSNSPRLTKFSLQPPKSVEVEYANGSVYNMSAEFLRIYSPAADSKIRSVGGEKVIYGRRHVGIMSGEPVGNYGVSNDVYFGGCCRLLFDDLHKTGIYTWDYLYHIGSNKFTLMRNYVKTLKKHGLSRDPPRRK